MSSLFGIEPPRSNSNVRTNEVFARFEITPAEIESLANEAKEKKTIKPVFRVDVVDEQNKLLLGL